MFTLKEEVFSNSFEVENFDEQIVRSLNILCSESMIILQNNSKVLNYLTDKDNSLELKAIVKSLNTAIKRERFELVESILSNLADNTHKLAALEIMYFDEFETLLRSDVIKTFLPQKYNNIKFIPIKIKQLLDLFNKTAKLSPTNAAMALRSSFETGEQNFVEKVILQGNLKPEFLNQIQKRYLDSFGVNFEDDLEQNKNPHQVAVKHIFEQAV